MNSALRRFHCPAILASVFLFSFTVPAAAADPEPESTGEEAPLSQEQQAYLEKVKALDWVKGPTTVTVAGNSQLAIPEGYLYLDKDGTSRYLELNENMSSGTEIMVAPRSMEWQA